MKSATILGSGNVATNLATALYNNGFTIDCVFSRSAENALELAKTVPAYFTNSLSDIGNKSDVYFLCLSDDAAIQVTSQLKIDNKPIFHTSGTLDISILRCVSENRGVFYPLQTFTKSNPIEFTDIPICIEANNETTLSIAQVIANSLSKHVFQINSEQRKAIHIAAVFANNFTNHLYHISQQILKENDLSFSLLIPLIEETTNKLKTQQNPKDLQTGPAKRNDKQILHEHSVFLSKNSDFQKTYNTLTGSILKTHNHD